MHIIELDRLSAADQSRAGGKAWNCARMKQAGFPVPDGLVVLSTVTADELAAVAGHPWFDSVPPDTLFAVRSSGIGEDGKDQSFAGIHQTLLDVRRSGIAKAVAGCQASAFSAQALEYRRAQGISTEEIHMGVLIQRMVHPLTAGVAFTSNPVTGSPNELVINASWGVGEALVSGQVDPDEFVVRKRDGELLSSRAGDKTAEAGSTTWTLEMHQVLELASLLLAIEQHYGSPQDVEWCYDGNAFWIVQSRPVTTLRLRSGQPSVARRDEIEWSRANLAEILPDITSPQTLASLEDLLNRAERQFMGKLMAPEAELGPTVKSFHGRLYFNLEQLRHICAMSGVAPAVMLRSMGHSDVIQPADEQPAHVPIRKKLSAFPDMVRIGWKTLRAEHIVSETRATLDAFRKRAQTIDPKRLTDTQIWSAIQAWCDAQMDNMQGVFVLTGVSFYELPIKQACEKVGFPFERLLYPQLAAGERSVSAQQAFDLVALVDVGRRDPAVVRLFADGTPTPAEMRLALRGTTFLAEFDRFLENYGHRGRYETDWALPRYTEDPAPLLHAIRAHLQDGATTTAADVEARQQRESVEAWAEFERCLSPWQRRTLLPRVRRSVAKVKQFYLWRERLRSDLVRTMAAMRKWYLALADRFVERGWLANRDEYFQLHLEEIAQLVNGAIRPATIRPIVAERIAQTARHRSMQMPLLMRESELAQLIRMAGVSGASDDDTELIGHPVSGGSVEAEVVVIRDPGDFDRMKRGAILVAPATDPSWTPLFTLASGVIVEVGGVLSHASTIAREYGLPALANVKHATRRLRTGERVRLDAINGVVVRLESGCGHASQEATREVASAPARCA